MQARPRDTSPEAWARTMKLMRELGPERRAVLALAASGRMKRVALDSIRRAHPEWREQQVRVEYVRRAYGEELARGVLEHLER